MTPIITTLRLVAPDTAPLLSLGLLLMACLLPWTAHAAEPRSGPVVGDLVRVTVYGQPDLTTLARVSTDQTISFPFIGQVRVGGVSTAEAEANIARALDAQGIVRNPQVNVLVETGSSLSGDFVTILGHVHRPGRYSLGEVSEVAAQTLLDLLAAAGGTTESANSRILVFRGTNNGEDAVRMEIDVNDLLAGGSLQEVNMPLSNGDVVIVPEVNVFYIYGQISQPGRYPLGHDMMVMHAISVGGGVTERGNENGIVLTRREGNGSKRVNASLDEPLRPGDVIYVRERFF
jgi:polysaccharide biosynthesis/export protein